MVLGLGSEVQGSRSMGEERCLVAKNSFAVTLGLMFRGWEPCHQVNGAFP